MVTKGIITELIGKTQAKVRIPIYDKSIRFIGLVLVIAIW